MSTTQSILVIDDDHSLGEFISAAVAHLGIRCVVTTDPDSFLKELTPEITLVMIDLVMPKVDGVELLRRLAELKCDSRIILMSGLSGRVIETAEQLAKTLGLAVTGHLRKPFRLRDLERAIESSMVAVPKKAVPQSRKLVISDDELKTAIKRDEFVLHYQPQIALDVGAVVGVEALVRWQHPIHGLVFPDSFIARIEALGLIDDLGWIVVRHAFSEIGLLRTESGPMPVALNCSIHSLQDLSFPDKLTALATEKKVLPQNTIIELTESGLLRNYAHTLDVLARLRVKHFELSIDDFGTGYSMMQQLQTIPATELKIDKSFVQNKQGNKSDLVMVIKTIEIGHELGMRVVGEGVETTEQLDFLRANHCDLAQGYLFSRPLPVNELAVWLQNHRTQ
jgi:EAL domain-containing protein (putative c-di-GMP-specific phosphodiesterase class I)/ActR/RegA family two-component response regulator